MITRQQHNEAIRKARRERAQYVRDKYLEYGIRSYPDFKPKHKKLSEEERGVIGQQIRKDWKKSRRRSMAVFAGTIFLIAFICFLIFYSW
jgi:hypothetical protein